MNFNALIKSDDDEMVFLTPKDKAALRQEIAADVNAYLEAGGTIEILPPGKSTNLDHDETWRSFSI